MNAGMTRSPSSRTALSILGRVIFEVSLHWLNGVISGLFDFGEVLDWWKSVLDNFVTPVRTLE
jgi:hypothetical protein